MNQRLKGSRRDKEILQAIEDYGVLNTEQVKALFFSDIQSGLRKAQERLYKLHKRDRLNRCRFEDGPYCYYRERKPKTLEHLLGLNWVRIWVLKNCRTWDKIHSFNYEQDYGVLRTDGFVAINNLFTKKYRFVFLEMDRGFNKFDKVAKYCKLYTTGKYESWWWAALAERFPEILIVTATPGREKRILDMVKKQNTAGLEFKVQLLENIRKEVLG